MSVTLQLIYGLSFGFEVTEGFIEDNKIGYFLLDFGLLRIQFAWYS
jgi:hypothetical protein